MQVRQLRRVIDDFADFSVAVCESDRASDLRQVAAIFPSDSKATTANFSSHLKKSLPKGGRFKCPLALRTQLERIEAALTSSGAKAASDIKSLLDLCEPSVAVDVTEFVRRLVAARDYVPPAKATKPKGQPQVDAVVVGYVDRFKSTAAKSGEFEAVFRSLKADAKLSDGRIKKISKALWGLSAKSREEAFDHILAFHNREALSHASSKALELSAV
jgi:hypothetical protein